MVIGPAPKIAAYLRTILAAADVQVTWHRHTSGLLRESSADVVVLDGADLIDATAAVRRATAATLLVVGANERVAATCLAIGADAWFERREAERFEVYEQTMRTGGGDTLTLVTIRDTRMLDD